RSRSRAMHHPATYPRPPVTSTVSLMLPSHSLHLGLFETLVLVDSACAREAARVGSAPDQASISRRLRYAAGAATCQGAAIALHSLRRNGELSVRLEW